MKKILYITAAFLALAGCRNAARQKAEEPVAGQPEEPREAALDTVAAVKAASVLPEEPIFDIVTSLGTIKVKLYKDTPKHRHNFEKLALAGYYDSLRFHRVMKGFMIQGGDPYSRDSAKVDLWGTGGPGYTLPAEMRDEDGAPLHRHKKGALAAARRGDQANPYKESSGSQFYLVQDPDACVHLDGEYTVFGETVAGLNVIDKIAAVPTGRQDRPLREVRILTIKPDEELNKRVEKGTADE